MNLPSLPPEGVNPDGTRATMRYDHFSRVTLQVWDEEGILIDILGPFWSVNEAVTSLAGEYPRVTFNKEDQ